MRYVILADIHSNLAAFQAVLEDVEIRGGFDKIWCLGDVVGYGPDPHECISLLREYDHICVAGNHDWASVGRISTLEFNQFAAQVCLWTRENLTTSDVIYLEALQGTQSEGQFTLVHGSPRNPVMEYLLSIKVAVENFSYFNTPFCCIGHSHIPLIFEKAGDDIRLNSFEINEVIELHGNRLIINPGGVGQPRDNDPRASYVLYDSEANTVRHFRVEYPVNITQAKMRDKKFSEFLIARLSQGC